MDDSQSNACALAPAVADDVAAFVDRTRQVAQAHALDLSSDEDLGIGIMNLISIEEHLFFTASKTGKAQYYDLLLEIREIRKSLLKKLVVSYEGEVWCISKHLLASSMRLMEVGTKELKTSGVASAQPYFAHSYRLFRLFWELILRQPPADVPAPHTAPAVKEVIVYFEPGCVHCQALAAFLAEHQLHANFTIRNKDVTSDAANRAEVEALHRSCLDSSQTLTLPVVVQDGQCAMGEAAAIRFFKSLMWDNVKTLKASMAPLLDTAAIPGHVKTSMDRYGDAVDAALNCCKE